MWHIGLNIKRVREFFGYNQKEFAELFGISGRNGKPSEDVLSTYERNITPPPMELVRRIAEAFKMDFKRLSENELLPYDFANADKVPPYPDDENKNVVNDDGGAGYLDKSLAQAILKIANANELLAKSHYNFSESNRTLAENSKELIQMVKANSNGPAQIGGVALPNTADFLEVLAEVASGELHFENKHEAAAALHRRFFAHPKKVH